MFEQSQRAWFRLAQAAKRPLLPWVRGMPANVRGSADGMELRAVGPWQRGKPGGSADGMELRAVGPWQHGKPGGSADGLELRAVGPWQRGKPLWMPWGGTPVVRAEPGRRPA